MEISNRLRKKYMILVREKFAMKQIKKSQDLEGTLVEEEHILDVLVTLAVFFVRTTFKQVFG